MASGIRARKSMRQLSSTGNLYNFDKLDLLYVLSLFVVDLKLVKQKSLNPSADRYQTDRLGMAIVSNWPVGLKIKR